MGAVAGFIGWCILGIIAFVLIFATAEAINNRLTQKLRFIDEFVDQGVVNSRIRELAVELKGLFDAQVEEQKKYSSESLHQREHNINSFSELVSAKKERFWEVVNLAKKVGFDTPSTIEEALVLPIVFEDDDDD